MKRLIIALAMLMPTPVIAETASERMATATKVMNEGKVLGFFLQRGDKRFIIISHENQIYKCTVGVRDYHCRRLNVSSG